MKLLVNKATGAILDASNVGAWQVPAFAEIVEVAGDAETYTWPGGHPTHAVYSAGVVSLSGSYSSPGPPPLSAVEKLADLLRTKGVITPTEATTVKTK